MDRRIALVLDEKENHDQAVKRFRSLCDMHRITCGEAGNLRQFVTALKQDRHFAMDFWSMVGELSARERGTLSDDEMLAMIVEGASGKMISELPLSDKVATAELKNMLAGIDVDAPVIEEPVSEPATQSLAESPDTEPEPGGGADAETSTNSSRAVDVTQTKRSVEDALRRLEETSRELRDQLAALAAIDQNKREADSTERVPSGESAVETKLPAKDAGLRAPERQTPAREAESLPLASPEVYAPEPHEFEPLAAVEPVFAPRRAPRTIRDRNVVASRQFSTLSHRGFAPHDGEDDPTIPVPLAEYAEANSRRVGAGTILLIFLLMALVAGGYALHKGYGREQLEAAKAALLTKIGLFGEELHDVASPSSSTRTDAGSKPQSVPSEESAALQPTQANDRSQQSMRAQQNAAIPSEAAPHRRPESERGSRVGVRSEAMPVEPGAVRVPASVMEGNLLSSRVPVYPEDARAMGIEGPVEVEAVISRAGVVEYARALSGDPRLRAAAEDAVMRWRYKPYLINGTPVQAVTQVRLNFRLR